MKAFVVIPAYNEEHTIGALVHTLREMYDYTIVVVNDQSIDNTSEEAKKAGAVVINMPLHLGAWCCMQTGMEYALRNGSDVVVTMDADGQHRPEDVECLVQAMENENADMLIGSCVCRGSTARKVAWCFFRFIGRIKHRDITSGFRVYNRHAVKIIVDNGFPLLDYQDMGIIITLTNKGCTICEQDITMECRLHGKSRVFSSWPKTIEYMITTSIFVFSKRLCKLPSIKRL